MRQARISFRFAVGRELRLCPDVFRLHLCLLGLLALVASPASDQLCGIWYNEEHDAKLEIYEAGGAFEAKILWLKEPLAEGKPKVDKNNPDPALRDRPTLGLVILHGLHKTDEPNRYDRGRIYDPKNGKTYNCQITLKGETLELRGFVLGLPFLGRTAVWTRSD